MLGRLVLTLAYVLPALLISVVVLARPDSSRAAEGDGYLDAILAVGDGIETTDQDLTAAGATDWAIWGYAFGESPASTTLSPDVRRSGGSAISDLVAIRNGENEFISLRGLGAFSGLGVVPWRFDWSNGDTVESADAAIAGLQWDGHTGSESAGQDVTGYGFRFTVPAGTAPQRLQVYVHAHGSAGRLVATLSDESATSIDSSYVDLAASYNVPGLYTIDFAADSAAQTLTVEYTMSDRLEDGNGVSANPAIYAVTLAPQLVDNGGFEEPELSAETGISSVPAASPALTGWTVSGVSIDHIRTYWDAYRGAQSIDLAGGGVTGSTISQTLATVPGQQYRVTFAYAANPDGTGAAMQVQWNDGVAGTFSAPDSVQTGSPYALPWQTGSIDLTATSSETELSFVNTVGAPYGMALDDVSVTPIGGGGGEEPTEVTAPVLMQAVPVQLAGNVPGTGMVGLTETPGTYDLAFSTSDSCVDGVLGGEPSPVGSFQIATTADAPYFVGGFEDESPMGDFIAVEITGPGVLYSATSACIAVGPDNDSWVRALPLILDDNGDAGATGRLDSAGNARWYKFSISPGARVSIDLTGLPADYDLFLFKDIAQAFNELNDPKDLVQISAEFAPSAFAPSAFAPSAFAPSAFAPSAFAPSAFAPSAFAPSAFAPSAFAPSAFAPSAFAPSAFAPSAFAPSAFAPSAFAPSAFAPSAFAPSAFAPSAFAGAQVRSLIGISAMPATGSEWIVADTWNNTGDFYVRVSGKNGEFDTQSPFTLDVSVTGTQCGDVVDANDLLDPDPAAPTAPAGGYETIILTDSSRMPGTITRLAEFATEVDGVVVNVDADPRVAALNVQADTEYACPFAKNLVAQAIKDVVDAYRAENPIRYIVIVGGDDVIPFFRYPDQSLLGPEQDYVPPVAGNTASEASLRTNHVLGQDEYGSERTISLRAAEFPVPDLPVGRLVETPADVAIVLAAYLDETVDGVAASSSSLVTGYDFIADAADAIADELSAGTGVVTDRLVSANTLAPEESWTAADLRTAFLSTRHDLVFLGGHFSANSALAADFATSIASTELDAAANMTNSIIFSIGCHAGYNIVDPHGVTNVTQTLDWPQAFAQKGATLIAGTGYQYGDTDFIEYSERIYAEFAHQLRVGTGPVSVGEALIRAKQAYLRSTPDIRGLHEKALLESTLFGLPMLSVDMPQAGRVNPDPGIDPDASEVTGLNGYTESGTPGDELGLQYADVTAGPPNPDSQTRTLTNIEGGPDIVTTFLTGPDGNTTNPAEPALPLEVKNVSAPGTVLRGVGFRGGDYEDVGGIIPLTGAPNTEIRGVHIPFSSNVFYPMRPWTVNYFDALATAGGSTHLLITPAQHRSESLGSLEATLRRYASMDLRLFYSNNTTTYAGNSVPALSAPPAITGVSAVADGTTVTFRAKVTGDPAAGIQEVWVTYTGHDSKWESVNLTQDPDDSTLWTGSKTFPSAAAATNLRFMVQAVNGVGLVTVADDLGAYYAATIAGAPAPTIDPSTLSLAGSPVTGAFGSSVTVTATLESDGPVADKPIVFTLGGTVRIATTDDDGVATTTIDVTSSGALQLSATFPGDDETGPSTASQGFNVTKAATQLAITGPGSPLLGVPGQITATLKSGEVALTGRTVAFRLTAPGGSQTVVTAITDISGIARIPAPTSPVGIHAVAVTFGSPVTVPGSSVMDLTDPAYAGSSASTTIQIRWPFAGFFSPVDNPSIVNIAKAGSTIPVKFSLGGNRGLLIAASGYPKPVKIVCYTSATIDTIEEFNTANSGLTYDAATGQYTYNWKTPKTYVNSCYRLDIKLIDGTTHSALFKFK